MKKSTIWFLTVIMALTFVGLLYVQIMYMGNMVKMRDDQFAEGVKRSLYAVTTNLEQDETKHFLEEDAAQIESSFYSNYSPDGSSSGLAGVRYTFKTKTSGLSGDLTLKGDPASFPSGARNGGGYRSMQEILRGQYLYQKGLLNEVILNIISQSSNRPISERADSATVARYLRSEFDNNGLDLPFEYAVVNRAGAVVYKSGGYEASEAGRNNTFVQTLFPNDPKNKMNYLKVYFPTKKDYIFSSIKFMIPSFMFTFILLVIFLYTIIIAFRQKKLTEKIGRAHV